MVCRGSPTTHTSSRSPVQASSSSFCSGLTSWYSSTTKYEYRPRTAAAASGCSARIARGELEHGLEVHDVALPAQLLVAGVKAGERIGAEQ